MRNVTPSQQRVRIYTPPRSKGKGLVLREPTVVAVDKVKDKMLKIGEEAKKTLGRTPANVVAIHPIRAGVISDYDMSALMLRELVSRITSFSLAFTISEREFSFDDCSELVYPLQKPR